MTQKHIIAALAVLVFVLGGGYILYAGRPVMKLDATQSESESDTQMQEAEDTSDDSMEDAMENEDENEAPTEETTQASNTDAQPQDSTPGTYTLADVQTHNSVEDCWTVIDGNVYDLTTWISRHPGGPGHILELCGTDGTNDFNNQHGKSRKPASMLALLKIGSL